MAPTMALMPPANTPIKPPINAPQAELISEVSAKMLCGVY
jgi:hypothetical protein